MTLPIDYNEVLTLVLIIFGIIGMMRGWYREGVTALFVAFLSVLVWRPELSDGIIEWINSFIRFILAFFKAGLTFNTSELTMAAGGITDVLDPNSYRLWIVITLGLVAISYSVGEATFSGTVSPLSRLLGGLFGAANGLMLFSLFKQFLTNYWSDQGRIVAQTEQVAIQMTNVPADSLIGGFGIVFVLIVLFAVIGLLVAGDHLNLPLH